ISRNRSAVCFAERVAASNKGNCFFVVHCHTAESFTDIARSCERIRVSPGAFWIDVDQPHLYSSERVLKIAIAGVAFVGEPLAFRAPIDVRFGFPCVGAAATETESLEAH